MKRAARVVLLGVTLLVPLACARSPVPAPNPFITPTPTFVLSCSAPYCPAFGVLQCGSSAGCPGGCGTVCTIPTRDPNVPVESRVVLRLATGDDGTHDNPTLQLIGKFKDSPYAVTLDNPGDLQPGGDDTYNFTVPLHFCDLIAFQLLKPGDDNWSLVELSIDIADIRVYFSISFNALNPITDTTAVGGGWDDNYYYTQFCTP